MQKEINKAKLIAGTVAISVVIILLIAALFFCENKKRELLKEAQIGSCVKIFTNVGYGSGMIYCIGEDEIIIATAAHVLEGFDENARIEFVGGERTSGLLCEVDENADVGILSVPKDFLSVDTLEKINEVNITQDAFDGEPSYSEKDFSKKCVMYNLFENNGIIKEVCGDVTSMDEYVYDFDRHMLSGCNSEVTEGMSGGPIFDEEGFLLGMLLAGNAEGDFKGITYFNLVNR